ncbi:hypothetical protein [Streptomyces sp. NPDC057336]|uniref:hypothetical protein n=1 Tax=Streptomyces sp. NPDC057336 TaxID=3346102 RepID=UPI00362A6223
MYELEGGTAVLPEALLERVRKEARFDRRVTCVQYHRPDRPSPEAGHVRGKGPRVRVDTVSGGRGGPRRREQFTADVAVVPQSWLRGPYACGASVLPPERPTELLHSLTAAEGPWHLAGNHTCVKPARNEGAGASTACTPLEVHTV